MFMNSTIKYGHSGNGADIESQLPHKQTSSINVVSSEDLSRALAISTRIARQKEILKLYAPPDHWRVPLLSQPFGRARSIVFRILCLVSFGHDSLDPIWAAIRLEEAGDERVWFDGIRQIHDRIVNMLVVAGLLLATSAGFLTSAPPRASMINYTLHGPYLCVLGAFSLIVGGIITGSAWVIVLLKLRPAWAESVLYGDRFHVYCTLIMLSYPTFSIAIGSLLFAFGLLSAVWCADDHVSQGGGAIAFTLPISIITLFIISCIIKPKPQASQ